MTSLLTLLAGLLCLLTFIPISKATTWWVRGLDFPRLQLSIALGLWIFAGIFGLNYGWHAHIIGWGLVILCLIYQLWWIIPYSIFHRTEVKPADKNRKLPQLTLLTSNVLMDNRDSEPLLNLVKKYEPDILATLETDDWWQDKLDTLDTYPYRLAHSLDNKYGMHVYSRLPLESTSIDFLVEDDIPSMSMRVKINGENHVRLHVLHPRPPAPGENPRSIERDVELLVLAKALQDIEEPMIVSGDLNDVAWSRTTRLFRRMSGLLDIRVGRGMFNTFNANYFFIRWPLDHIFVSSHFRVVKIQRLSHIGSDHFPVLATMAIGKPDATTAHLDLQDADHELVEKTLATDVADDATEPSIK